MPRFFFHVRSLDGLALDEEGQDQPDLNAAREEAIEAARDIMSELVFKGVDPKHHQFEIADGNGAVKMVVRFGEALSH